jgi:RNA polymerase sigma factor (sigma-70 family)
MKKLTREEVRERELELIELYKAGNSAAGEALLQAHAGVIYGVARKYVRNELPLADALQEARAGFLEGVVKFDPTRGTRLLTYAPDWAMHRAQRAMYSALGDVRVPEGKLKKRVMKPIRARRLDAPLVSPIGGVGPDTLADIVPSNDATPHELYEGGERQEVMRKMCQSALRWLSPQERRVVRMRYLSDPANVLTFKQIGKRIGVTHQRAHQIWSSAEKKLKERFKRMGARELLEAA